jgi:hypothetical protein
MNMRWEKVGYGGQHIWRLRSEFVRWDMGKWLNRSGFVDIVKKIFPGLTEILVAVRSVKEIQSQFVNIISFHMPQAAESAE